MDACSAHQKPLGCDLPKDPVLSGNILAASRSCSRWFPSAKADVAQGSRMVPVGRMLPLRDGQTPSRDPV